MQSDFKDLLSAFNDQGVEYLVVGAHALGAHALGAHALAAHGHVRATKDLGVWVRAAPHNAPRVLRALAAFGAPLLDLSVEDLSRPGVIFQIGVAPVRIDVLTTIDGVEFDSAWPRRIQSRFDGLPVPVLSREDLIANKKSAGRLQDLADVERLERERG